MTEILCEVINYFQIMLFEKGINNFDFVEYIYKICKYILFIKNEHYSFLSQILKNDFIKKKNFQL